MAVLRICENCHEEFTAQRVDAKTCSKKCRDEKGRKAKRLALVPDGELDEVAREVGWDEKREHPSAALSFPLLNYVEDLLEKHKREDLPQARLALVVARRLDVPGLETGASIVSLSKELDRLLGVALAG